MIKLLKNSLLSFAILPIIWAFNMGPKTVSFTEVNQIPQDSTEKDSILPYPANPDNSGGLYLDNPGNFTTEVEYDPISGLYILRKKIGDVVVSTQYLTPQQYQKMLYDQQTKEYWQEKVKANSAYGNDNRGDQGLIPQIQVDNEIFGKVFGNNIIDIKPQGSAEIIFAGRYQKIDNPTLPTRNRSTFNFDFDQRIQLSVTGKVGTALELGLNYDTEATFAFENKMKLEYNGQEDDIIKKLEMGNVSLPTNSSLITGAQSLFGLKGQFQFGKTTVTGVFSEQRSQSQSINVQGGGTQQQFELKADAYEANRHYFLAQYFRDNYESHLDNLPLITSPTQITKVEVWVTNKRSTTQDVRNILAFMDLGETENTAYRSNDANLPGTMIFPGPNPPTQDNLPTNRNNNLDPQTLTTNFPNVRYIEQANPILSSQGLTEATEFVELVNARKLDLNQFTFHPQLGYISLNSALNQDEILAVAFQYTANGKTYQVGEFSNDGVTPPKTLILKMLKSTILDVKIPVWDLMMKNVYALGGSQIDREGFYLDVLYWNDETGVPIPFLPDGNLNKDLLLRVMKLDRLNANNDVQPDGLFDFVEGVTINSKSGRLIFPVVEPFGSHLNDTLDNAVSREKYVYQELYDSTKFKAQEQTRLNKFLLRGRYKAASGSEIFLNAFNIPKNSVVVTAGGTKLTENQDYTVDYTLGRVKIINESIMASGAPIKVSFENNTLFSVQTKTFMGVNFDHRVNEDFNFGGSFLRMSEKPLTQKTNMGEEPIANNIWGLNGSYQKDAPILTRIVDAIPGLDTKEPSRISVQGEFAQLIPGSPKGIKINGEETTYIDDFESAQSEIDIKSWSSWSLATTPSGQPDLFPEGELSNDLAYNYNRAKLAWYIIDPIFLSGSANTPQNIKDDPTITSDQYQRQILIEEIFPAQSLSTADVLNIATFDMAYYPEERGPYNFDILGSPGISSGLFANGTLARPETRWAGITRPLNINNFEEQNIEFIQFWLLDPYLEDPTHDGGDLYFNLGNVSEDVLKDGRQSFENGMDINADFSKADSTVWGLVPKIQPITEFFDNEASSRPVQDVGFDGLNDFQELVYDYDGTGSYTQKVTQEFGAGSQAAILANNDAFGDNFKYYKGSDLDAADADILERYKNFNGPQGNSSTASIDGSPASSTNIPDKEDANKDQTLSKTESYYQYRVSMRINDLDEIGKNYITDIKEVTTNQLPDGTRKKARWIQFKIPVFTPDSKVGTINDFRSIRFMRMFLKDYNRKVVLRFARLDLVRGEWRRYRFSLDDIREDVPIDENDETVFEVNAVNLVENETRQPVPYVLPPGIDRQVIFGTSSLVEENEQSLSLYTCNLKDGDARAVFKNLSMDMRMYKRMKMFVHAEDGNPDGGGNTLRDGDVTLFVRMGSDYNQNYYEYEIPLRVTPWGTPDTDPDAIWIKSNEVDLPFEVFKSTKLERDRENFPVQARYTKTVDGRMVSVIGYPNIGNVRTMMIGIRNPKKVNGSGLDDGLPKCTEVWVNELRLSDFDQRGGWAANARVTANMADFADLSLSANMSTVGFGAIDQSVSERNKFEQFAYDFQSRWELGNFFSQQSGVKVPLFFSYSEDWKNPQFNPLDPDIEFDRAIENISSSEDQDELRRASQDYTQRKNINLTNVRKERRGGGTKAPHFYDIENFSVSYSFSEEFRRNINTASDLRRDHKGALNYNFQTRPKNVQPFKSIKSQYLTWIKDFNFYYIPNKFTFRSELNRTNSELQMRNVDNRSIELPQTYNKSLTFNRIYDLGYDLSKSIKIDYNAKMNTRVDEIAGPAASAENRDTILWGLKNLGRPTQYHQTARVTWQVPINKFPFLDFTTASLTYSGNYDWQANSTQAQDPKNADIYYGNTIQNSASVQGNMNFNLITLYNNVPYLKKINQGGGNQRVNRSPRARVEEDQNKKPDGEDEDKKKKGTPKILDYTVRALMMVRSASFSYTKNEGTLLPGFVVNPVVMGLDPAYANAPGLDFVFGSQFGIAERAAQNSALGASNPWLTPNSQQPNRFSTTLTENLNIRATVEPFQEFRIDVTATRVSGENANSLFRFDDDWVTSPNDPKFSDPSNGYINGYRHYNEMVTGNYSISFWSFGSAFEKSSAKDDYSSDVYNEFLDNRLTISQRKAAQEKRNNGSYLDTLYNQPDSTRYGYNGYSVYSQDVLLPAFLAAYGGYDVNKVDLNSKPSIPLPNWKLNYNGLMKMEMFRKRFNSFTLSHGYRSLYTISNFQTNLQRQQFIDDGETNPRNENNDFLPELQVAQVTMTEAFRPLIGFNMRMKNNASFKLEMNRDRNVGLSLTNNTLTETKGSEIVIGAGYIIKDVKFTLVRTGASRKPVVSNLELKGDLTIRDNQTVIRKILEGINQVTAGQRIVTIKLSADYQLSRRVSARIFYDQVISKFKTSNAFPTNNIYTGFSFRLNLAQ